MADNNSIGKITLDLEIQSDIERQIGTVSKTIGAQLKTAIEGAIRFDTSKITNTVNNSMKSALSSSKKSFDGIKNYFRSALSGAFATIKDIKLPKVKIPKPDNVNYTPSISPAIAPIKPRAPSIPKVSTGVNTESLKAQIDNLTASIDNTNAKIEFHKDKLIDLKEQYNNTFNLERKNKLQEQILKTETAITKLIAASDKTGFKLADLDSKFEMIGSSARGASAGVNAVGNSLNKTSYSSNKAGAGIKLLGNSTKEASRNFGSAHNQMHMMMRSIVTWGLIFPAIIKSITAMGRFLGQSLMTNAQFANSLMQIKSNLYTAFMPIYEAVLPAINALMSALSRITAYIASFTSSLFGKTYKQSFNAAKGMIAAKTAMGAYGKEAKKAGQEAKGALAGFDEINTLNLGKDANGDNGGGGGGAPEMVMPSADTSALDEATSAWANKFKTILGTIFQPFKNAWTKDGAGVMAEFKAALDGTKGTLGHFFYMLATPPVQLFIENIARLILAIVKLGLKIYDSFILPIVNGFISLLPGAAKGLNPILNGVTEFVNYLSGDGFKYVQLFLSVLGGLFIAFKAFNLIQTARIGIQTFTGVLSDSWAILTANPIVAVIALIIGLVAAFAMLYASNENFRNKVNEIGAAIRDFLAPVFENIKNVLLDVWNNALVPLGEVLIDIWHTIIEPLSKILTDVFAIAFKIIAEVAKDLWDLVLVPLADFLVSIFVKAIQAVIDIYNAWKPAIQLVIDIIMFLWNNALKPLLSFLGGVFIGTFQGIFDSIGDIVGNLKRVFSGIIDFITGVFTGNWERAWQGIRDIFGGIFGGLGSLIKAPLNAVIGLINGAISGINKISFDVPDWVPGLGGKHFGARLPKVPYLARGGVLDSPTLAMVGEAGKEAVIPLENNTQGLDLLAEKLMERLGGLGNSGGTVSADRAVEIVIQLGGYEFARFIIDSINKLQRQSGKTLIEV